jgi:hypothetical protein
MEIKRTYVARPGHGRALGPAKSVALPGHGRALGPTEAISKKGVRILHIYFLFPDFAYFAYCFAYSSRNMERTGKLRIFRVFCVFFAYFSGIFLRILNYYFLRIS